MQVKHSYFLNYFYIYLDLNTLEYGYTYKQILIAHILNNSLSTISTGKCTQISTVSKNHYPQIAVLEYKDAIINGVDKVNVGGFFFVKKKNGQLLHTILYANNSIIHLIEDNKTSKLTSDTKAYLKV